ncbi:MAG: nuclear transport factor 2 family protein [Pseudomonadales bacterium]
MTNTGLSNKEAVEILFSTLWTDPEKARSVCTDDVTWVTTRSMPIPGNEDSIYHIGFDAVLNVANSGKQVDNGYLPETVEYPHQQWLDAEDDHVIYQFTMQCRTKKGTEYLNDYLFLVKLKDGKVQRMQEYWDSKQAFDLIFGG